MTSKDSTIVINLETHYGDQAIFVRMNVAKAPAAMKAKNEKILLDFRNGYIDRIHDDEKRIQREMLTGPTAKRDLPSIAATMDTAWYLSHPAVAYVTPRITKQEKKDSSTTTLAAEIKIWYATDLIYPVPDSMKMVQMVPLFTNGHIALGSTIALQIDRINLALNTRATAIRKGEQDPAMFRLPAGYKVDMESGGPQ